MDDGKGKSSEEEIEIGTNRENGLEKDDSMKLSETGEDDSSSTKVERGSSVSNSSSQIPPAKTETSPRANKRELEKAIERLDKQRTALGDHVIAPEIAKLQVKLQHVQFTIKKEEEIKKLREHIASLENARGILEDATVDASLKPLKEKLALAESELKGKKNEKQENEKKDESRSSSSRSSTSTTDTRL